MKYDIDDGEGVYYEEDADSTDELFLHDDQQLMIQVPIERHQYANTRPRKKSTGDILDYLEYSASSQMIEDSVNRLYQPKMSSSSSRKTFLMKGYGQKASDRGIKHESPRSHRHVAHVSDKEAVDASERLYTNSKRTAAKMDEKRQKKLDDEQKPGRWKPEKKLNDQELGDLRNRLCPNNTKRCKENTLSYLCKRLSEPLSASNITTYTHVLSLNTMREISPDDPIKKKIDIEAPFRKNCWTGCVQRSASAHNTRTDKLAISGIARNKDPTIPPPSKLYNPPADPFKSTKSIEHKQRVRIYPSSSPGWK